MSCQTEAGAFGFDDWRTEGGAIGDNEPAHAAVNHSTLLSTINLQAMTGQRVSFHPDRLIAR